MSRNLLKYAEIAQKRMNMRKTDDRTAIMLNRRQNPSKSPKVENQGRRMMGEDIQKGTEQ